MKKNTLIRNELLRHGYDDWVDSTEVAWIVQSIGSINEINEINRIAVSIIKETVSEGFMVIGNLDEHGFHKWDITTTDALNKIEKEWLELNRRPKLGEICWLCNTPKGDEIAKELIAQEKQL